MDRRTGQLICAWCGPLGCVLCAIGLVPLAHFLPPPSPDDSAMEIVARFHDHATGIRAGMVFCSLGFSLIAAWGAALAARTYRAEGRYPVLTFVQVTLIGVALFIGVLFSVAAQLATFRAGSIDPAITVTLNDATWFIFLIWAPFDVWLLALALAVLLSTAERPPLPRWTGWLTVWIAFLSAPASMIPFFKTGPFAYDGLLSWYVPAAAFFIWLPPMTYALLHEIKATPIEDSSSRTRELPRTPAAVQ